MKKIIIMQPFYICNNNNNMRVRLSSTEKKLLLDLTDLMNKPNIIEILNNFYPDFIEQYKWKTEVCANYGPIIWIFEHMQKKELLEKMINNDRTCAKIFFIAVIIFEAYDFNDGLFTTTIRNFIKTLKYDALKKLHTAMNTVLKYCNNELF